MNGIHYGGSLDKLARTGDLRKEARQSDNLSDQAARALQTIGLRMSNGQVIFWIVG
jgi:hypothetical protein